VRTYSTSVADRDFRMPFSRGIFHVFSMHENPQHELPQHHYNTAHNLPIPTTLPVVCFLLTSLGELLR
jgi:hypothetical protein